MPLVRDVFMVAIRDDNPASWSMASQPAAGPRRETPPAGPAGRPCTKLPPMACLHIFPIFLRCAFQICLVYVLWFMCCTVVNGCHKGIVERSALICVISKIHHTNSCCSYSCVFVFWKRRTCCRSFSELSRLCLWIFFQFFQTSCVCLSHFIFYSVICSYLL